MKKIILLLIAAFYISAVFSQNTFKALVKDSARGEFLSGASAVLKGTTNGGSVDSKGEVMIGNIPNGEQTIVFTYIGYKTLEQKFNFPMNEVPTVFMAHD